MGFALSLFKIVGKERFDSTAFDETNFDVGVHSVSTYLKM